MTIDIIDESIKKCYENVNEKFRITRITGWYENNKNGHFYEESYNHNL